MCVNSNRTARKTSRSFSFAGDGAKRTTAAPVAGSFAQTGRAMGYRVGNNVYESIADAEKASTGQSAAPVAQKKGMSIFGVRSPTTGKTFAIEPLLARSAQETATAARAAPAPAAAPPRPEAATAASSAPVKKRVRIRPGAAKSATASLSRTGVNLPN